MSLEEKLLLDQDLVAHFTSIKTAVTKILFTGELRFSRYKDSGDALESSYILPTWGGTVVSKEGKEKYIEKVNLTAESQRAALKRFQLLKFACFCQSANSIQSTDDVGALRPRMWTQYSQSHRGACIVFSAKSLISCVQLEFPKMKSGQIEYKSFSELSVMLRAGDYNERMKLGKDAYENMEFEKLEKGLGYAKHRDFESESEFRISFEAPDNKYSFVKINNAIRGLLVSKDVEAYYREEIIKKSRELNVPWAKIDWEARRPRFDDT